MSCIKEYVGKQDTSTLNVKKTNVNNIQLFFSNLIMFVTVYCLIFLPLFTKNILFIPVVLFLVIFIMSFKIKTLGSTRDPIFYWYFTSLHFTALKFITSKCVGISQLFLLNRFSSDFPVKVKFNRISLEGENGPTCLSKHLYLFITPRKTPGRLRFTCIDPFLFNKNPASSGAGLFSRINDHADGLGH